MGEAGWWILGLWGCAMLFMIALSVDRLANAAKKGAAVSGDKAGTRPVQVVVAGPDDLMIFRVAEGYLKSAQRDELRNHIKEGLCGEGKCFVLESNVYLDTVVQKVPRTSAAISDAGAE